VTRISLKALYKLFKLMNGNLNIPTALHIFDHTIKPILLYGAEIWSPYLLAPRDLKTNTWIELLDKHKPCQLEIKFYKRILQVKNNTPTIGIRGEIGRHPILLDALANSIKYIESINSKPDSRLVKEALKESEKLKTTKSWNTKLGMLRSHIDTVTPATPNKPIWQNCQTPNETIICQLLA
jgi:hypothetical protein